MRTRAFAAAALLLALWLPAAARAQSSQASLQGQVMNPASGEPIARALVIQRNILTNTQGYRYTNEQGFFSFPALPPGTYTLRVDAMGFQPEERSGVELPVAGRVEVNFALTRSGQAPLQPSTAPAPRLGENPRNILAIMYGADAAVPQAVLIRLPVSQVETVVGSISSLIDENKILELPLGGRDVYTLLVLQPDVTSDNATARGLGFSVNGQQSGSSNFLLDGVDNNDLQVTGPAAKVSADAVKEYRMSTNNFTAEFGRNAGFIANAITRSGTNRFHGSLFEFFNHETLNANSFANNWQDLPKEPNELNQFGGTLGGPVMPDQLFFFGGFEQLRSFSESPPQTLFLPSAELIALVPANSEAKKLLSSFPPPAGDPLPGIFYAVRTEFRLPLPQVNSFALGRGDYSSADGRHRITARYAFSQNTQEDFATSVYPGFDAPLVLRGQNVGVNYTRDVFGGTNELKFGFNRNSVRLLRPHPELPALRSTTDGITLPGSEVAFDYFFRDTVLHVLDSYSRLSGSHALIAGFEWRPYLHDSLLSPVQDGIYDFFEIGDFIFDQPYNLRITVNRDTDLPAADADFRRYYFHNELAAFFQDNWKPARRLTLNLGIRWEYFGTPSPRKGLQDHNFLLGPGSDLPGRIATGRIETGTLFSADRNNFAPRFGFAYDLLGSGRTVLRGGYGLFFDRVFNNFWMDSRVNSLALGTFSNLGPTATFRYKFPARDGVLAPSQIQSFATIAVDPALKTPFSQTWFLGLQREVSPNLILDVNHSGSLGRKLATSDVINRQFSRAPASGNALGRFNPSERDISYRSNQGVSNHVALQMALSRRWSQGMQFQISYTLARTRDVQSDPFGRNTSAGFADRQKRLADVSLDRTGAAFTRQFDPSSDYGNSDFDQRHNLVFSFVGQMPALVGLPNFFSRWQVSVLAGFRSGFPFSVGASNAEPGPDNYLTGLFIEPGRGLLMSNRADYWGQDSDEAFLAQAVPIEGGLLLLDSTKFAKPPSTRLGNMPRNAFSGPGFWNADLSFSRGFVLPRLGERTSLQFRVELFNAFNHTNLNPPDAKLDSFGFGQAFFGRASLPSSASPNVSPLSEQARRIQLAIKVYF